MAASYVHLGRWWPVALAVSVGLLSQRTESWSDACARSSFDACEQDFQEEVMALFGQEESQRQEAWCNVLQDHKACLEAVLHSCRDDGHKELSVRIGRALADVVRKGCDLPDSWSSPEGIGTYSKDLLVEVNDEEEDDATEDSTHGAAALQSSRHRAAEREELGRGTSPLGDFRDLAAEHGHDESEFPSQRRAFAASSSDRLLSQLQQKSQDLHALSASSQQGGGWSWRAAAAASAGQTAAMAHDTSDSSLTTLLSQLRSLTRDMKRLYKKLPKRSALDADAASGSD